MSVERTSQGYEVTGPDEENVMELDLGDADNNFIWFTEKDVRGMLQLFKDARKMRRGKI